MVEETPYEILVTEERIGIRGMERRPTAKTN